MKYEIFASVKFVVNENKPDIDFYRKYDNIIFACIYFVYITTKLKKYMNDKNIYVDLPKIRVMKG